MGVGKWELNGELQESLGTAAGEGSMVSGQRMVNLQWEMGDGAYRFRHKHRATSLLTTVGSFFSTPQMNLNSRWCEP